jgi:hypothetical protein
VSVAEVFVVEGSDMVNGRAGHVKLKDSGAGSMTVARAYNEILFGSEETLNVSIVMRSLTEGNGALGPGDGNPGNGGTAKKDSIRNAPIVTMSNTHSSYGWLHEPVNVVDQISFSNYYRSASHPV